MNQVLSHIRPLLLAIASLAVLCASSSMTIAQVPAGATIDNQASGTFRFRTGARDTVRSNTARTVVTATEGPYLLLQKSVDLASVAPGGELIYTLKIDNEGSSSATVIRVVDSLPANTTFVSASAGGALSGKAIVWTIPTLAASGSHEIRLVVRVDPAFLEGKILNRARLSCEQGISAESNLVQSTVNTWIASNIALVATRDAIIGNGSDTTTLGAIMVDAAGVGATDGTSVFFSTTRGHFPNGMDTITVTTLGGRASTVLTSDIVINEIVVAQIVATTISASGKRLSDSGSIRFYSGAIAGTLFSTSSRLPIVGADVFAFDMSDVEVSRDTSDNNGDYLLPVPDRGDYTLVIRYTNRHGEVIETRSVVSVDAPAGSGGTSATAAPSSIAGTVIDQITGRPLEGRGIPVTIEWIGLGKRTSSSAVRISRLTDTRGAFLFDSLAPGRYRIRIEHDQYQGSIDVVDTVAGMFVVDSDIEASEIARLQVVLTATKRIADIGDVAGFAVEVTNSSRSVDIDRLLISSTLPPGFSYVVGSSRIGALAIPDPSGSHTRIWQLADTLAPGSSVKISYRVIAAAGAIDGDGTTRVHALAMTSSGDSVRSETVEAVVDVRPGVFTDRGIIIGKIYYDANESGYQDGGEEGIPGVELWMEDGTRVVTGEDGRYSLPQVMPGERVVRVNRKTLPTGSRLVATGTAFSDDPLSRFVSISEGSIVRADFHALPPTQGAIDFASSHPILLAAGDTAATSFVVRVDDPTTMKGILLSDTLPVGLHYDLTTLRINGTAVRQDAKKSRILALQLKSLTRTGADTVTISIVADSAGVGLPIGDRGMLILSYPTGREAIFKPSTIEPTSRGVEGSVMRYEPRRYYTSAGSRNGRREGSS